MSPADALSQTVEVPPAEGAHAPAGAVNLFEPSFTLMVLTWITFALLAAILYKVAWKPILKALDLREKSIRKSLEDAERARTETAELEERGRQLLQQSEAQARQIVAEARTAAQDVARTVEARAGAEARAVVDEARREIQTAVERARADLRRESADLAIALASKVVAENMDNDRNRTLVQQLTKEL